MKKLGLLLTAIAVLFSLSVYAQDSAETDGGNPKSKEEKTIVPKAKPDTVSYFVFGRIDYFDKKGKVIYVDSLNVNSRIRVSDMLEWDKGLRLPAGETF